MLRQLTRPKNLQPVENENLGLRRKTGVKLPVLGFDCFSSVSHGYTTKKDELQKNDLEKLCCCSDEN
jgi:hypothetical protein